MFDKNFTLKICDFGLAVKVPLNGLIKNDGGTREFMAPEIRDARGYYGYAADVFACGVILYQMVVGESLFKCARESDPFYKLVLDGKYKEFWEKVFTKTNHTFSTDLKHLIEGMICSNPL
jgi:MAP/microtubule affinity-regulating kinase